MADTQEQSPNSEISKSDKSSISFSIWPPSQRTRDTVISRLIETFSFLSILSSATACPPRQKPPPQPSSSRKKPSPQHPSLSPPPTTGLRFSRGTLRRLIFQESLTIKGFVSFRWPLPFGGGESENKINILRRNLCESNEFGELCEVKPSDFRPLKDFDVTVSFANITQGGMSTIFFDSKAFKIFVVTNGAGQFEMACPHLAQEQGKGQQSCGGFQESQGQQGHGGSQEQEQGKNHLPERIIKVMGVMKIKLKYFITFLNFLNEDFVISLRNYSVGF
ncbi:hypothetical protein ACET3Z_028906 [Daucus carota]